MQDGLLSQGYSDFIMRVYNMIPKVTPEGRRLQVGGRLMMSCDSQVWDSLCIPLPTDDRVLSDTAQP